MYRKPGEPRLDRAEALGGEVDEPAVALDEGATDAAAGGEEAGGAGEGGEHHHEQDDPEVLAVLGDLDPGEEHQQVGGDGAGDAELLDEDEGGDDEQGVGGEERAERVAQGGGESGQRGLLIDLPRTNGRRVAQVTRTGSPAPSRPPPAGIS